MKLARALALTLPAFLVQGTVALETPMPLENYDTTFPIQATDPGPGPYPGGRGPEQLVVYTPAYGPRTGTNPWGFEVTVREGVVAASEGGDSAIPLDGFVISAHGKAAAWLEEHAAPGARARIENQTLRIVFDDESRPAHVRMRLDELAAWRARHGGDLGSVDDAVRTLREEAVRLAAPKIAGDPAALRTLANEIEDGIAALYYRSAPAPDDVRGVWHRPVETSEAAIDAALRRFADGGFRQFYLETFWAGRTIYASRVAEQHGNLQHIPGYLDAWIRAGKRHGVEIHAWVHVFHIGSESYREWGPLPRLHPHWVAVNRRGVVPVAPENGHVFACPNEPEFRAWLFEVLDEIMAHEGLAGLQLDYIRYPLGDLFEEEYCLCSRCVGAFFERTGLNARLVDAKAPEEEKTAWKRFRIETIDDYVRETRRRHPGAYISAAVFHDLEQVRGAKAQDWLRWAEEGWVDALFPMVYMRNPGSVAGAVGEMVAQFGESFTRTGLDQPGHQQAIDGSLRLLLANKRMQAAAIVARFESPKTHAA